jgi:hypothetical protein
MQPHRRRIAAALGVGLIALTLGGAQLRGNQLPAAAEPGPPPPYRVVINPQNPSGAVDRRFLSQVFLRKTTSWAHGDAIRAVDLPPESPVRRRFSEEVHGRSVAAVKSYWQQVIFSGRGLPPPELATEEAVLRFVSRNPGAIGYVSGGADLRAVKVLAVR